MSRLIVPAHAKNMTKEEQQASDARQVMVTEFKFIVPGLQTEMMAHLPAPVPLEGLALAAVQIAYKAIEDSKAQQVADRILNGYTDSHVN